MQEAGARQEEEEESRYESHVHRQEEEEGSRYQSHTHLQEEEEARQEEEEGSRYLSHVHLQDTLLEVAQLCPDVVVNLASRCYMLCGDYDTVPFH